MAIFGKRDAKVNLVATPAKTKEVAVAGKPSNGGGSSNPFAQKRVPISTEELKKLKEAEEHTGLGATPAAKGGAASFLGALKVSAKELTKSTARLTTLRTIDESFKNIISRVVPPINSEYKWLTKIPFIGKKLAAHIQEKQATYIAQGVYIAGFITFAKLAGDIDEQAIYEEFGKEALLEARLKTDKYANLAKGLQEIISLQASGSLVEVGSELFNKLEKEFAKGSKLADDLANIASKDA